MTPSTERVRSVLNELYAIDPSLREHAADLERIVAELLAIRPEATVNSQFVKTLRASLQTRAAAGAAPDSRAAIIPSMKHPLFLTLSTATVAVAALLLIVVVIGPRTVQTPSPASPSGSGTGVLIARQSAHAFGNLSLSDSGAVGMGGGGGLVGAPSPERATASAPYATDASIVAPNIPVSDTKNLIAPVPPSEPYIRDRYVYDGPLPAWDPQLSVYRHTPRSIDASALTALLSGMRLGTVDLGSFGSMNVQQVSFMQPDPQGYQVYVDVAGGTININQNNNWPNPYAACREQSCYERLQLSPSDVPDDATLTGITDAFLNGHGISKDAYGSPAVDRAWSRVIPMVAERAEISVRPLYTPDVITVIYPLVVEGTTVYDQSGNPFGLSVSVSVREKKVVSVWNLTTQQYDASSYDVITDEQAIRDMASRGDLYAQPFGQDPNERTNDMALQAPERVLMQAYHVREDGVGEEILVPALRFPVSPDAVSAYGGYRTAVMVPLVKGLLDQPIMYLKGGAAEGSVGTGMTVPPSPPTAVDAPPAPSVEPKQ